MFLFKALVILFIFAPRPKEKPFFQRIKLYELKRIIIRPLWLGVQFVVHKSISK